MSHTVKQLAAISFRVQKEKFPRHLLIFAKINRSHTVSSADPLDTKPPSAGCT